MRVLSLFSGGGLGDFGLTLAGMEIVGQVEIDEYCQKILSLRWPDVPKWRDIREVKGNEVLERCGRIDLISGGFPCQPFSTAGRRTGKDDNRYLWPEMLRVIREVRPRWVLAENVPGLLSISDGRVFGTVIRDLAESGYGVEWDCIPASAFGAPHRRDRVWIVGYSNTVINATRSAQKQAIRSQRNDQQEGSQMGNDSGNMGNEMADALGVGFQRMRTKGLQIFQTHDKKGLSMRESGRIRYASIEGLPDWCGGSVGQPSPITEFERSSSKALAITDSDGSRRTKRNATKQKKNRKKDRLSKRNDYREIERDFRGMAHGCSNRIQRLKLLGNSQVVQVVEWIGSRILEYESSRHK